MTNFEDGVGRRVALITSQAYSLTNFRGPMMRDMINMGCTIYALAPDHDAASRARLAELGVIAVDFSLDRTGMKPVRDVIDTFKLTLVLRKIKPDIVLSYFVKPVIYGSIAAKLAGIPKRFALIAGLGHAFAEKPAGSGLRHHLTRLLAKNMLTAAFRVCSGVIFQNEEDRDEFTVNGNLRISKTVRTNGTGVDLEQFKELVWPPAPMTFIMAARLIRPKGVAEYAAAAKRVKAVYPDAHFILLGGLDANPEGLSQSEVESLVAAGGIEWPGHVNDVTPYLARSHVFVLPSYYREGVPRGAQEALASGRAIITTDNVGCRETVDLNNGILVPIKNVDALAYAMLQLCEHPETARRYGQASRKLAEIKFNVKDVNHRIMSFLGI